MSERGKTNLHRPLITEDHSSDDGYSISRSSEELNNNNSDNNNSDTDAAVENISLSDESVREAGNNSEDTNRNSDCCRDFFGCTEIITEESREESYPCCTKDGCKSFWSCIGLSIIVSGFAAMGLAFLGTFIYCLFTQSCHQDDENRRRILQGFEGLFNDCYTTEPNSLENALGN